MNSICAYIDEYGAYGNNFEAQGVSTHFILSAILVKREDVPFVETEVDRIRKKFFQNGEMKSSSISKNHRRRLMLLTELKKLPFKVLVLVVDKRKLYESGLSYKKSFYKFLSKIVYDELRSLYPSLDIMSDQVGGHDFKESFLSYMQERRKEVTLFDEENIDYVNSKSNLIVQVADIISGSLAYNYDAKKRVEADNNDFKKVIGDKICLIRFFPRQFHEMVVAEKLNSLDFNTKVAEISYRKAQDFINRNADSDDIDVKRQVFVLKYLLFRFVNNSSRKYISTKELQNALESFGYEKMTVQTFRNKVIAKLRDDGVIIASSKHGLKIPAKVEEVNDFVERSKSILLPMLTRLKRCCSTISTGSLGEISILDLEGNETLKNILENID